MATQVTEGLPSETLWDIVGRLESHAEQSDARLDRSDGRMDARMDRMEVRLDRIDGRLDRLFLTVPGGGNGGMVTVLVKLFAG